MNIEIKLRPQNKYSHECKNFLIVGFMFTVGH